MTTSTNSTELTPAPNNSGYNEGGLPEPKVEDKVEAPPEKTVIQEMYDEPKPEDKVEEKVEDKVEEPEVVKDPATGYDDKIEPDKKPEEKELSEEEKAAAKLEADKIVKEEVVELTKEDVDSALGDLGEEYNKESISKFALDNKLSKDQIAAYVEFAKAEDVKTVSDMEERLSQQKNDWKKELKDDKEFSGQNGENFLKSVDQVEKVLENLMPNTKKKLTEGSKMLPPYIMRDILNVYRSMNPTSPLVNGDPSKPVKKDGEGNFLDDMYS